MGFEPACRWPARTGALIAVCLTVAGCGHDSAREGARAAATPPALLYVWRNFEETGVPDELTVYRDGALRYRNLLHTQHAIRPIAARLSNRELSELRTLVGRADVRSADASGVTPSRSGYRYVIRTRDGRGTAADGHLRGSLRPLVIRIRSLMDRLQDKSL